MTCGETAPELMVGLRSQPRNPDFGVSPIMLFIGGDDKRSGGEVPLDLFGVGNGAATALRHDAVSFDGNSRRTSSSVNAAADAADAAARVAAARAGEVTRSATLPALLS